MSKAEMQFNAIADSIANTTTGKMFGALCIKNKKGKAFLMMYKDELVVKLDKKDVEEALKLKGAKLFDPAGGRPMKEWVQVPLVQSKEWKNLAKKAFDYVGDVG